MGWFWIIALLLLTAVVSFFAGFMLCAMFVASKRADEHAHVLRLFAEIDKKYGTNYAGNKPTNPE